jgi:hypothetical protein
VVGLGLIPITASAEIDFTDYAALVPLDISTTTAIVDVAFAKVDYLYNEGTETLQIVPALDSSSVNDILVDTTPSIVSILDRPIFKISDDSKTLAGHEGTSVTVGVQLVGANLETSETVSIDYYTTDLSAVSATDDYTTKTGTLLFDTSNTTQSVEVGLLTDLRSMEGDEEFLFELASSSSAPNVLVDTTPSTTTITDRPILRVQPGSLAVSGREGTNVNVIVELVGADLDTSETVSVNYTTSDLIAVAPDDYKLTTGTLLFDASNTSQSVEIGLLTDLLSQEGDETFQLVLTESTVSNIIIDPTAAVITIIDLPILTVSAASLSVSAHEGTTASVTIELTGNILDGDTAEFIYSTVDITATEGLDYTGQSGTLNLDHLTPSTTVDVPLIADLIHDEGTESLNLSISSFNVIPTSIQIGETTATINILDRPILRVTDLTRNLSGQEGTSVTVVVELVGEELELSETVSVDYSTSDQTATSLTNDYGSQAGTLYFTDSNTTQGIEIGLLADLLSMEGSETLLFELATTSSVANILVDTTASTITIADRPIFQIEENSQAVSGREGTTVSIVVELVGADLEMSETVSVSYTTVDLSAIAGDDDYTTQVGALLFDASNTTQSVEIGLLTDLLSAEGSEEFLFELTASTVENILIDSIKSTITIIDLPIVSIAPESFNVSGNEGTQASVIVELVGNILPGDSIDVDYTTSSGTAIADVDYISQSGVLSLDTVTSSAVINIPLSNDLIHNEGTETFTLSIESLLSTPSTILLSPPTASTISILDRPILQITEPTRNLSGPEGTSVQVSVELVGENLENGETVSVNYNTVDQSATSISGDYTEETGTLFFSTSNTQQDIQIDLLSDLVVSEGPESFLFELEDTSSIATILVDTIPSTTTISDRPILRIEPGSLSVSGREGTSVSVVVELVGAELLTSETVSVFYTTRDQTAVADNDDYTTQVGSLLFDTSNTTQGVEIGLLADLLSAEGDEVFNFELTTGTVDNILIDSTPSTITITDLPTVGIESGSLSVSGYEGETVSVTVELSGNVLPGDNVDITYSTSSGTAVANVDYISQSGTVNLDNVTSSVTIDIPLNTDLFFAEMTESFTLTLDSEVSTPSVIGFGSSVSTIDILDRPIFQVSEAARTLSGPEGTSVGVVVELLGEALPVSESASVELNTIDGTAISVGSNADYTSLSQTLIFTASNTSQTVYITLFEDALGTETTELFEVHLEEPVTNAYLPDVNTTSSVQIENVSTSGILSVAPLSLNFGSIDVGLAPTESQSVVIHNVGGESLTFSSIEFISGSLNSFVIFDDTGEATLAPGTSRTLELVFWPFSLDPEDAPMYTTSTLQIVASDASPTTVTVALGGTVTLQDCDGSGVSDYLELDLGILSDCNGNGIPDSCLDGEENPDYIREWDCNGIIELNELSHTEGTVPGMVFQGAAPNDGAWRADAIGDFNGDGLDDLLIGAPLVDDTNSTNSGNAYIIYGTTSDTIPDRVSLHNIGTTYTTVSGTRIAGLPSPVLNEDPDESYKLGWQVTGLGDMNGDGLDDLALSIPNFGSTLSGDSVDTSSVGAVYVLWGDTSWDNLGSIQLDTLSSTQTLKITQDIGRFQFGSAINGAGDLNGDGLSELLISTNDASGRLYLIYGSSSGIGTNGELRLDQNTEYIDLSEENFTSIAPAGDIDSDGYDDFLIGSGISSNDRARVYVIKGKATQLALDNTASNLTDVTLEFDDFSSQPLAISAAGDINNDAAYDFLIGLSDADNGTSIDVGLAVLLLGSTTGPLATEGSLVNLSSAHDGTTTPGLFSYLFTGAVESMQAGASVSSAGDLDGDGQPEIVIGSPGASPESQTGSGASHLIFASAFDGLSTREFLLSERDALYSDDNSLSLNDTVVLQGTSFNDASGAFVEQAGDYNGDGLSDVLIGGPNVDNFLGENGYSVDAGATFLVYGHGRVDMASATLNSLPTTAWEVGHSGEANGASEALRARVTYPTASSVSTETVAVQLFRSISGFDLSSISEGDNLAQVAWFIDSNRTNELTSITLQYTEAELNNQVAHNLKVYRSDSISGSWNQLDPSLVDWQPEQNLVTLSLDNVTTNGQYLDATGTYFILAGELAEIGFVASEADVIEGETANITIRVITPDLELYPNADLETIRVSYTTVDATTSGTIVPATGGLQGFSDYQPQSGILVFNDLQEFEPQTIAVPIYEDEINYEGNETFHLLLSLPENASIAVTTTATITITDKRVPEVRFETVNYSFDEPTTDSAIAVEVVVDLFDNPAPPEGIGVFYRTSNGTAVAREFTEFSGDYAEQTGFLSFDTLTTLGTYAAQATTLTLYADSLNEVDEHFFVELFDPTNAVLSTTMSLTMVDVLSTPVYPNVSFTPNPDDGSTTFDMIEFMETRTFPLLLNVEKPDPGWINGGDLVYEVNLTTNSLGTATQGDVNIDLSDFSFESNIRFKLPYDKANDLTTTFTQREVAVTIHADTDIDEITEWFELGLREVEGGNLNLTQPTSATVNIQPRPYIVSTYPTHGESGINPVEPIIINFSKPIRRIENIPDAEPGDRAFNLESAGVQLGHTWQIAGDRRSAIITPASLLPLSQRVRLTVNGDKITDDEGFALDADADDELGGRVYVEFQTPSITNQSFAAVMGSVFAVTWDEETGGQIVEELPSIVVDVAHVNNPGEVITYVPEEEPVMYSHNGENSRDFSCDRIPAGPIHFTVRAAGPNAKDYGGLTFKISPAVGEVINLGEIFLPKFDPVNSPFTLPSVNPDSDNTYVSWPIEELSGVNNLDLLQVTLPPASLLDDTGTPLTGNSGSPEGLRITPGFQDYQPFGVVDWKGDDVTSSSAWLQYPLVLNVETSGVKTIAEPLPVQFPIVGLGLEGIEAPKVGEKAALVGYIPHRGMYEFIGSMTVQTDDGTSAGRLVAVTDPGVGIRHTGWYSAIQAIDYPGGNGPGNGNSPKITTPPNGTGPGVVTGGFGPSPSGGGGGIGGPGGWSKPEDDQKSDEEGPSDPGNDDKKKSGEINYDHSAFNDIIFSDREGYCDGGCSIEVDWIGGGNFKGERGQNYWYVTRIDYDPTLETDDDILNYNRASSSYFPIDWYAQLRVYHESPIQFPIDLTMDVQLLQPTNFEEGSKNDFIDNSFTILDWYDVRHKDARNAMDVINEPVRVRNAIVGGYWNWGILRCETIMHRGGKSLWFIPRRAGTYHFYPDLKVGDCQYLSYDERTPPYTYLWQYHAQTSTLHVLDVDLVADSNNDGKIEIEGEFDDDPPFEPPFESEVPFEVRDDLPGMVVLTSTNEYVDNPENEDIDPVTEEYLPPVDPTHFRPVRLRVFDNILQEELKKGGAAGKLVDHWKDIKFRFLYNKNKMRLWWLEKKEIDGEYFWETPSRLPYSPGGPGNEGLDTELPALSEDELTTAFSRNPIVRPFGGSRPIGHFISANTPIRGYDLGLALPLEEIGPPEPHTYIGSEANPPFLIDNEGYRYITLAVEMLEPSDEPGDLEIRVQMETELPRAETSLPKDKINLTAMEVNLSVATVDEPVLEETGEIGIPADTNELGLLAGLIWRPALDFDLYDNPESEYEIGDWVDAYDGAVVSWKVESGTQGTFPEGASSEIIDGLTDNLYQSTQNLDDKFQLKGYLSKLSVTKGMPETRFDVNELPIVPVADDDIDTSTLEEEEIEFKGLSASFTDEFKIVPGEAAEIQETLSKDYLIPCATDELTVDLVIRDSRGNLVSDGTGVSWELDGTGEILEEDSETIDGMASATIRSGIYEEDMILTALVGDIEKEISILHEKYTVTLSPNQSELDTYTEESITITATAQGILTGQPLPAGTPISWAKTSGTFSSVDTVLDANGQATLELSAVDTPKSMLKYQYVFGTVSFVSGAHSALFSSSAPVSFEFEQPVLAIDRLVNGSSSYLDSTGSTVDYPLPAYSKIHLEGPANEVLEVIAYEEETIAAYDFEVVMGSQVIDFANSHNATASGNFSTSEKFPYEGLRSILLDTASVITISADPEFDKIDKLVVSGAFLLENLPASNATLVEKPSEYSVIVTPSGNLEFSLYLSDLSVVTTTTVEIINPHRWNTFGFAINGDLFGVSHNSYDSNTVTLSSQRAVTTNNIVLGNNFAGELDYITFNTWNSGDINDWSGVSEGEVELNSQGTGIITPVPRSVTTTTSFNRSLFQSIALANGGASSTQIPFGLSLGESDGRYFLIARYRSDSIVKNLIENNGPSLFDIFELSTSREPLYDAFYLKDVYPNKSLREAVFARVDTIKFGVDAVTGMFEDTKDFPLLFVGGETNNPYLKPVQFAGEFLPGADLKNLVVGGLKFVSDDADNQAKGKELLQDAFTGIIFTVALGPLGKAAGKIGSGTVNLIKNTAKKSKKLYDRLNNFSGNQVRVLKARIHRHMEKTYLNSDTSINGAGEAAAYIDDDVILFDDFVDELNEYTDDELEFVLDGIENDKDLDHVLKLYKKCR